MPRLRFTVRQVMLAVLAVAALLAAFEALRRDAMRARIIRAMREADAQKARLAKVPTATGPAPTQPGAEGHPQ